MATATFIGEPQVVFENKITITDMPTIQPGRNHSRQETTNSCYFSRLKVFSLSAKYMQGQIQTSRFGTRSNSRNNNGIVPSSSTIHHSKILVHPPPTTVYQNPFAATSKHGSFIKVAKESYLQKYQPGLGHSYMVKYLVLGQTCTPQREYELRVYKSRWQFRLY